MASLSRIKDTKSWRIQFMCVAEPGKRRTLRVSGLTKRQAEEVHRHVESIVGARLQRTRLEDVDSAWLGSLTDKFHARLVRVGLDSSRIIQVPEVPEEPSKFLLTEFLQDHIDDGRTSQGKKAAQSTLATWRGTQSFLGSFLGSDRLIGDITAEDAHQFRRWLDKRRINHKTAGRNGKPMAENAKRKHIANCKMFFNAAKRRGLLDRNPFEAQVSSSEANRSRDFYVTPEITRKLLDAAPDTQWRLLIALWRLAGLRKMEVFNLTWGDIQLQNGKMLVRSTKTQHHEGCEIRYVPIRDVQRYLEEAFSDELPEGQACLPADAPVITRFSRSNNNLDKPFKKIVEDAGLIPWPKLFQNLRSSCETQWLKEGARADLVANWIGHSVKVQNKNYVQHTEDDIVSFNSKPGFKSDSLSDSDNVGIDENRRETAEKRTHSKTNKNAETQCFSYSNQHNTVPRAGIEPARSYRNLGF